MQIDNAESKNARTHCRQETDYKDVLDMYADDFDEKEKARIEQQAQLKKKAEEAASISSVASEAPEIGRATGNGIAKVSTSSDQEDSKGNYCSSFYHVSGHSFKG